MNGIIGDFLFDTLSYCGTTEVLEFIAGYLGKDSRDGKDIMKIVERNRKDGYIKGILKDESTKALD